MSDPHANALLDAVDALTKPTTTKVIQETADGGTVLVAVVLPSLLDQLDYSIRESMGIAGSGSQASVRNMLNGDALFKSLKMKSIIQDWARTSGVTMRHGMTATELLRGWYVLFVQVKRSEELTGFHLKMLSGWAHQIETALNPPRTKDLPDPCPTCGADTWWQDGQKFDRPLIMTFHEGPDMIERGKGVCRACETVFGFRELSYAIECAEGKHA